MYYICEKRTQKLENLYGIRDTDDNVVEYYTPRDIIHFIKELNIPIQGVSQDDITKRWTFTVMNFTATSEDVGIIPYKSLDEAIEDANNMPLDYPTGVKTLTQDSIVMKNFAVVLQNFRALLSDKVETYLSAEDNVIEYTTPMKDPTTICFDNNGYFTEPFTVEFSNNYFLKGLLASRGGAKLMFCYSYSKFLGGEFILYTEGGVIPYLSTERRKGQIYKGGAVDEILAILKNKIVAEKSTDSGLVEESNIFYITPTSLMYSTFIEWAKRFYTEYKKLFDKDKFVKDYGIKVLSIEGDVDSSKNYSALEDSSQYRGFKVPYKKCVTIKVKIISRKDTCLYLEMATECGDSNFMYKLFIDGTEVEPFGFVKAGDIIRTNSLHDIQKVVFRTAMLAKKRKEFLELCYWVKHLVPEYKLPNYLITVKDRGKSDVFQYGLNDLPIWDIEFASDYPVITSYVASTDYINKAGVEREERLYLSFNTDDCTFALHGKFSEEGISAFESIGFPKGFLTQRYRISVEGADDMIKYIKAIENHPRVAQEVD